MKSEVLDELEKALASARFSSLRGGSAHIRFRELCFEHTPALIANARRANELASHNAALKEDRERMRKQLQEAWDEIENLTQYE